MEFCASIEHIAHIFYFLCVEMGQVERIEVRTLAKHLVHILDLGRVEVFDTLYAGKIRTTTKPFGARRVGFIPETRFEDHLLNFCRMVVPFLSISIL